MKNFFVNKINSSYSVMIDKPDPRDPEYQATRNELINNKTKANFAFEMLFKKLIDARLERTETMEALGINPTQYDMSKLLMNLKVSNNDILDPEEEKKITKLIESK